MGSGGGLLIGQGGVVSAATSGTFATEDGVVTNVQTVSNGDTVQLTQHYDTPTFAVGAGTTNSTVNPGDVVDDGGVLHRYVGSSALTGVDFESGATPPNFASTTNGKPDWITIGGDAGRLYKYIGASGKIDLNNQNYADTSLWTEVAGASFTTQDGAATDVVTVKNGDTVKLAQDYDTATYSVGTGTTPTNSTVNPGDVVDDSGALYRYVGAAALTGVDFEVGATPPNFTSTTNGQPNWIEIGGTGGHVYKSIGPGGSLDLNNQDYTDASRWSDVTGGDSSGGDGTSTAPSGDTPSLGAGLAPKSGGDATSATESPSSESQSSTSVSFTAAGVYTENKIAAAISATVENTAKVTTGAGGLDVEATDDATITSIDGAAAVSANFSASDGTATISIGIGIARNTIQESATASVTDAGTIDASGAPVTIKATQESQIEAISVAASLAISASDDKSVSVAGGASLADNLIGVETSATLTRTQIGQSGAGEAAGALTVSASDISTIDATVAAASAAVSFSSQNATAVGIGASLAHNRVGDGADTGNGAVGASITDSTIYAGAVDVEATSHQNIDAQVIAAAVAVSGSAASSTGFTGAGAFAFNEIGVAVSATIDGGSRATSPRKA